MYHAFRPGAADKSANHRYLVGADQYNAIISRRWTGEGVAFCAIAVKNSGDIKVRADLVRQAAEPHPNCNAIAPFYYEVGDKQGSLVVGSVGGRYTASTLMPIASSRQD